MYLFGGVLAAFIVICLIDNKHMRKIKKKILTKPNTVTFLTFMLGVISMMSFGKTSFITEQLIQCTAYLFLASCFFKAVCKAVGFDPEKSAENMDVERLPKKLKDRVKIVRNFNNRYSLNLTDKQINNIAEGSFLSEEWAEEIKAMNNKYQTISEWYAGDTGWLRAYLKAFNVQSVVPDSGYQKRICLENFDQLFTYVDSINCTEIGECVEMVNNKYMSNFDELSFMLAYRFLEKNGRRHRLPGSSLQEAYSEIDDLARKYDNHEQGEYIGDTAYGLGYDAQSNEDNSMGYDAQRSSDYMGYDAGNDIGYGGGYNYGGNNRDGDKRRLR